MSAPATATGAVACRAAQSAPPPCRGSAPAAAAPADLETWNRQRWAIRNMLWLVSGTSATHPGASLQVLLQYTSVIQSFINELGSEKGDHAKGSCSTTSPSRFPSHHRRFLCPNEKSSWCVAVRREFALRYSPPPYPFAAPSSKPQMTCTVRGTVAHNFSRNPEGLE